MAILGNLELSQAISGYLGLSRSIFGYIGLPRVISGYLGLSQAILGYLGLFWAILGYLRLSRSISGYLGHYLRLCLAISGHFYQVSSIVTDSSTCAKNNCVSSVVVSRVVTIGCLGSDLQNIHYSLQEYCLSSHLGHRQIVSGVAWLFN